MSQGYQTLNDTPHLIEDDFYRHFVTQISEEVKHSPAPKTIAITGYWGSGKTSALAQIYKKITKRHPPFENKSIEDNSKTGGMIGVWFEAWRYQNEEQPVVALLHAIKQEFTWRQRFKEGAEKLMSVGFQGALGIFDSVIKAASGASSDLKNIPKIGDKYEKDNLLSILPTDMVHLALEKAINEILKGKNNLNKKLVIFIDDLDRCQPHAALKLLEGLKLYLNIPNCVIVMAIDQAQLEQAIKNELGDSKTHHFVGVEYLEKLCQDAHRLPLMSQEQGASLIKKQLKTIFTQHDKDIDHDKALNITGLVNDIATISIDHDCLPANPRRIKMIINRMAGYIRNWNFSIDDPENFYPRGLVLLACLYVSYRQVYEQLEWNIEFYNDLDDFGNEGEIIQDDSLSNSSLEGLRQPKTDARYIGEPPSDLSIMRPLRIVQAINSEYKQEQFKIVLKNLINIYNGQPMLQEEAQ